MVSHGEERETDVLVLRHVEMVAYILQQCHDVNRLLHTTARCILSLPRCIRISAKALGLHLLAHLTHPLFLLCLTAQLLKLHTLLLAFHEAFTPEPHTYTNDEQEGEQQPTVTQQRRRDRNLQGSLVLSHRTVVIQHTYMEHITAVME